MGKRRSLKPHERFDASDDDDNNNDEDEYENVLQPETLTPQDLEQIQSRKKLTAKRRVNNTGESATANPFSGFGGFKGFNSGNNEVKQQNGVSSIQQTKQTEQQQQPQQQQSNLSEVEINFINDLNKIYVKYYGDQAAKREYKLPTLNDEVSNGHHGDSSNNIMKYANLLMELNKKCSKWIQKHVDDSPFVYLTPIFIDYFNYLLKLEKEFFPSTFKVETEPVKNKENGSSVLITAPAPPPTTTTPQAVMSLFPLTSSSTSKFITTTTTTTPTVSTLTAQNLSNFKFGPINLLSTSTPNPPQQAQTPSTISQVKQPPVLPPIAKTEPITVAPFSFLGNKSTLFSTTSTSSSLTPTTTTTASTTTNLFSSLPSNTSSLPTTQPFSFKPSGVSTSIFGTSSAPSTTTTTTTTTTNNFFSFLSSNTPASTTSTPFQPFSFNTGTTSTSSIFSSSLTPFGNATNNAEGGSGGGEGGDNDNEPYEPPKPEFEQIKEDGSVFTKRIKLYYFNTKDNKYTDRGIGNLHLKELNNGEKTQLIVRADTSLGNILLNVALKKDIPIDKISAKDVSILCVPNPAIPNVDAAKPCKFLFKVKTEEDANELLNKLNEMKK